MGILSIILKLFEEKTLNLELICAQNSIAVPHHPVSHLHQDVHFSYLFAREYAIFPKKEKTMREQVEKSLDKIRPSLMADGGNVELVDVSDDGIVKVRLTGACGGCPMSQMTLKMGVERLLKQEIPSVKEVVQV